MPKIKKIEDRTNWFIDSYNKLTADKKLPQNVDLAKIMGMRNKSTVTNILKREQNIQPEQWQKFKSHFGLKDSPESSQNNEPFAGEIPDSGELEETRRDLRSARAKIDAHVDFLQDLVKSSLGKLIEGQGGGLAVLLEVLNRDIKREAGGSADKEKEIREEIAHRIGPKLNADLRTDIARDGRN